MSLSSRVAIFALPTTCRLNLGLEAPSVFFAYSKQSNKEFFKYISKIKDNPVILIKYILYCSKGHDAFCPSRGFILDLGWGGGGGWGFAVPFYSVQGCRFARNLKSLILSRRKNLHSRGKAGQY